MKSGSVGFQDLVQLQNGHSAPGNLIPQFVPFDEEGIVGRHLLGIDFRCFIERLSFAKQKDGFGRQIINQGRQRGSRDSR